MPNLDYYAQLSNEQINELIADRKYGVCEPATRGHNKRWTSDLNLIFELIDSMEFKFELYHSPGGEWIGVVGEAMKYKSFDLCRVLCVLWLAQGEIPKRDAPSDTEAF